MLHFALGYPLTRYRGMTTRAVFFTFAVLATGLGIWFLFSDDLGLDRAGMASKSDTGSGQAPLDALQLTVEEEAGKMSTVRVLVRNTDPSTTFTVLRWDTPLDKSAFRTGALVMRDAKTGEPLRGPELKLNRMLPPTPEDLVEIPPLGTASQELTLKEPWMPKDRSVKIQGQGSWKAVWPRKKAAISEEEQQKLAGSDILSGEFHIAQEKTIRLE